MDPTTALTLINKYTAHYVSSMSSNKLCQELVADGVFKTYNDFNLFILEGIQRAIMDDDEFPIHFYTRDEPMSESGRTVKNIECLTDDYIADMVGDA